MITMLLLRNPTLLRLFLAQALFWANNLGREKADDI